MEQVKNLQDVINPEFCSWVYWL